MITDVAQEVMLHMQHILPEEVRLHSVILCANAKKDWTCTKLHPLKTNLEIATMSIATANFQNELC